MHWLRLFVVVMQRLLHFHYDVGRQDVEIYPCMKFFHSHKKRVSYMPGIGHFVNYSSSPSCSGSSRVSH